MRALLSTLAQQLAVACVCALGPTAAARAAAATSAAAAATHVRSLLVLGDSIADKGLPYGLWSYDNKTYPFSALGYDRGRFSNGPVWVEDLVKAHKLTLVDFAVGGAAVNPIPNTVPLSLELQKALAHLATHKLRGPVLGVVSIGANDLIDLSSQPAVTSDPATMAAYLANIVNGTLQAAAALLSTGRVATVAIAPTFITIKDSPLLQQSAFPPTEVASLAHMAASLNTALNASTHALSQQLGDGSLFYVDAAHLFHRVATKPSDFGLKNVSAPCLVLDPPGSGAVFGPDGSVVGMAKLVSKCRKPNDHLFWDSLHLTAHGHKILARHFAGLLRQHGLLPERRL